MNRRLLLSTSFALAAAALPLAAQTSSSPGGMSAVQLERVNDLALRDLIDLRPTADVFSEPDLALFQQIALGSMLQLELSRAAAVRSQASDVRQMAQTMVNQQSVLADKLKEIAEAKGANLPSTVDPAGQRRIAELQALSGRELDSAYLREAGVATQQEFVKTLNKVRTEARDATLRKLAGLMLPLTRIHQQAAEGELRDGPAE